MYEWIFNAMDVVSYNDAFRDTFLPVLVLPNTESTETQFS
jgi:hypothetical protein